MEKKKIIIFGSTGNVGSYLTLYAKNFFDPEKYEVIASGRRETKLFDQYDIPYCRVDLSKKEDFDSLPRENVHAVMLLAATIPSYMDEYDPRMYLSSIVDGGLNVLEYCRKVKADRILFTQTVFDVAEYSPDEIIHPYVTPKFSYTGDHAMYVICKNMMIEMMKHYHLEYGLKTFIFRLPTIYSYSPYHYYFPKGVKTMRPFYKQIFRAINSEPLEIWGDPNEAKDMVHVYDFSQMLCKAALVNREEGENLLLSWNSVKPLLTSFHRRIILQPLNSYPPTVRVSVISRWIFRMPLMNWVMNLNMMYINYMNNIKRK